MPDAGGPGVNRSQSDTAHPGREAGPDLGSFSGCAVAVIMMLDSTNVAILGAGKAGTLLLDLLHQLPGLSIVGITDKDPTAPGLVRARSLNIPTTDDLCELASRPDVNVIIDVTGDPTVGPLIARLKRPETDVLGGAAARLVWQLVQHESALQAQVYQAEKLAGIGSFAAGIAHDINNPLQLILGLAEAVQEEQNPTTIHEHATEIIDAVKRTTAICRNLTQYARRMTSDDFVKVHVNARLDDALKIARYATVLQDVQVVKDYAEKAVINARPEEMLHAFVNLIVNAIQAMDGQGTLTLSSLVDDSHVEVRIADTGSGIAPERLPRLFEPFFTTKEPGKGTGLGLYNVKSIVEQHLGKILVESTVGRGTTFRLIFPYAG